MSQGGNPALNIPPKSRHRKTPSDVAATLITKASNVIGSSSSNHQKGYSSSSTASAQSPIPKSVSASSGFGTSLPGLTGTPASSKWHPSAVDAKEALKKLGFEKTGFKFGKTHGAPQFDVRAFAEESFAPEQFVFSILRDTNEEGVRNFHSSLQHAKEEAAEDLKRNVYRNYNEFVTISKEISKLETDMLVLRSLLSELRSVSDSLSEDAPQFAVSVTESLPSLNVLAQQPTAKERTVPTSGRRGGSGGDKELEGLWRAQVSALWNAVEGSQKYIPWVPGRHVIRESTNVLELNRSFKPRQAVHLFLLSDSLLVATRKKKAMAMSSKHKLIADKCWGLSEIAVLDIKDSPELTNAFKITKHPDVFIYKTEMHEEKRSIIQIIRRVTEELMASRRKERESQAGSPAPSSPMAPRSSMETLGPSPLASEIAQPPTPSPAARRLQPQQSRRELAPADIQWMNDLAEELDVFIAHREFEDAVEGLEKARVILTSSPVDSQRVLQVRRNLEERVSRLSHAIGCDLSIPTLTKSQVQQNIMWLLRLGLGEQARGIFLRARSSIIRNRSRQLKLEGEISNYIAELSLVVFTLIKNTCDWYGSSFKEASMASGFVKWAKQEIELYADIFRRQVFHNHQNFEIIADCLRNAHDQCRLLRDVGLDLSFLLDQVFFSDILEAIVRYEARCMSQIGKGVNDDNFKPVDSSTEDVGAQIVGPDSGIKVTSSAVTFYQAVIEFLHDVGLLLNITLYSRIVASVTSLIDGYLKKLHVAINERDLDDKQTLNAFVDANYVIESFLPKISTQLTRRFDRPVPETENLLARLHNAVSMMQDAFCKKRGAILAREEYNFADVDYSFSADLTDNSRSSEVILKLILTLDALAAEAAARKVDGQSLVSGIIENMFTTMTEARFWESGAGQRKFGHGGVQQLVLDIHFFLKVCEAFVTEGATAAANSVCERALRMYFAQNTDNKALLRPGEWYDAIVAESMNELGGEFARFGHVGGA